MLHVLPAEVTLSVLSRIPIPSLLSLSALSRQWLDFFTTNQSTIFHSAPVLHEYIQPETLSLEDALSVNTGRPWAGSTSWKDFCKLHHHIYRHRSFQLHKNWEGNGRTVAREGRRKVWDMHHNPCFRGTLRGSPLPVPSCGVSPRCSNDRLQWHVRSFAHCEYDNGYLVFDRQGGDDGAKEVWRLASDLSIEGEAATDAPPDGRQVDASARAAAVYR
ncbi:hypothetical protein EDB87DRAFT_769565 [Lactarius vividus]|nr:hypothetical protein EDB87DRAFT_769565 [Lactarius vividus]